MSYLVILKRKKKGVNKLLGIWKLVKFDLFIFHLDIYDNSVTLFFLFLDQQARKTANFGSIGTSTTRDSDSESEELMPTRDPKVTAALARAITDSEDEGMGVPDIPTPRLSKESSINHSDEHADFCKEF